PPPASPSPAATRASPARTRRGAGRRPWPSRPVTSPAPATRRPTASSSVAATAQPSDEGGSSLIEQARDEVAGRPSTSPEGLQGPGHGARSSPRLPTLANDGQDVGVSWLTS